MRRWAAKSCPSAPTPRTTGNNTAATPAANTRAVMGSRRRPRAAAVPMNVGSSETTQQGAKSARMPPMNEAASELE